MGNIQSQYFKIRISPLKNRFFPLDKPRKICYDIIYCLNMPKAMTERKTVKRISESFRLLRENIRPVQYTFPSLTCEA